MPKFYMLVGLPCSGKSTYAKQLADECNAIVLSSDEMREELFGDINYQADNNRLFKELHSRIREHLRDGDNVIMDATNISYKYRREFLKTLSNIKCKKLCILIATPYEECLRRNAERDRKVPEFVIKRMYMSFNIPLYGEGWDDMWIEYSADFENSFGYVYDWVDSVMDFKQDNLNHTLSLGEHCRKAAKIVLDEKTKNSVALKYAALLHDEGKVFTKNFIDSRGNTTDKAHYYSHEYCGAYDSLFYEYPADHLCVAQIIQWHMRPYIAWEKSERSKEKDKNLLGNFLFESIEVLHAADVAAH